MRIVDDLQGFINSRRAFVGAFDGRRVGPTVHANVEVDLAAALAYRKQFNQRNPDARCTLNDMIVKAAGNALVNHRLYTCTYNGRYTLFPAESIDIRFPVDLGFLLGWGMVRNVERKTLRQVALESEASKQRAQRETPVRMARFDRVLKRHPTLGTLLDLAVEGFQLLNRLLPPLERAWRANQRKRRGSFLITNVGPAGITRMEGPIVHPDILHLMIAASRQVPVLCDGKVEVRTRMPLIAKFDHRITDVGGAARFLLEVKANLEDPEHRLGPYDA